MTLRRERMRAAARDVVPLEVLGGDVQMGSGPTELLCRSREELGDPRLVRFAQRCLSREAA